ncbi:hypothetical protein [Dulcicalothrix desertica]|uniref:hypothetical protein n=1 Tax=Dulcicalothrix desertica TaxID=32056 RepID=UPI000F8CEE93|nr:hypothetical protein [Dulcicalothrix desertica]
MSFRTTSSDVISQAFSRDNSFQVAAPTTPSAFVQYTPIKLYLVLRLMATFNQHSRLTSHF